MINKRHILYSVLLVTIISLQINNASPPHKRMMNEDYDKLTKKESAQQHVPQSIDLEQFGIEYQRYLQQVIETLESDSEFKKKLESANESDIRSGKIAEELEYVSHHVRSKLDELKRIELERLRHLAKQQYELTRGKNVSKAPGHLDHSNPDSFEISDLQRLIYKVAEDLQEADRQRKELFKEYEMQKHFERDQKLNNMAEDERKQFLQHEEEELLKKRTDQKKVHHPGSRQQLEEVWEKQDHMDKQDFNPKVFFAMHDLDSNGFLDEDEIKVLFINELNKLYGKSDLVERDEEMERMREHVFNEVDLNKDRLISWDEFYSMSIREEFNQDTGWKPIEENSVYTKDELEAFERNRQAEVNKLIQEGKIQPLYDAPPQYPPHHSGYHGPPPPPPSQNRDLHQQAYGNIPSHQGAPLPPAYAAGSQALPPQGSYNMPQGQQVYNIPQTHNMPSNSQPYGAYPQNQQVYGGVPQHGYGAPPQQQAYDAPPQYQQQSYNQNQQQPQVQQQPPQVQKQPPQVQQQPPQVQQQQSAQIQQQQHQVQQQPSQVQQQHPQVQQHPPQVQQQPPQVQQQHPQVQSQPKIQSQYNQQHVQDVPDVKFAQVNPPENAPVQQLPLEEQQQQPSISNHQANIRNDIPQANIH